MPSSILIKSAWLVGAFSIAAIAGSFSANSGLAVYGDRQDSESAPAVQEKRVDDSLPKAQKKLSSNPATVAHAGFNHSQAILKQKCQTCHRIDPKQTPQTSPHLLGIGEPASTDNKIDTAFLGLHASDVPASLRKHLKLHPNEGAIVEKVIDESPAYHCGIEEHDVVVAIDHKPVLGEKSLLEKVRARKPGTKILVEYIREGQKESCTVVLGKQRTAQILSSYRIRGCPAQLNSTTNCRDCHGSVSQ